MAWEIEAYQTMCCRVLQWYPEDQELAHDAAVKRLLESRRQPLGTFKARRAYIGWCLHFLEERCWTLLRRRTRTRKVPHRTRAGTAKRREAVYRSLIELPPESRELLEEWAYHGRSDRIAAEQQCGGPLGATEAVRRSIQRRRKEALEELRRQLIIDEEQEVGTDWVFE